MVIRYIKVVNIMTVTLVIATPKYIHDTKIAKKIPNSKVCIMLKNQTLPYNDIVA